MTDPFNWRPISEIPPRGFDIPLDALDGDVPPRPDLYTSQPSDPDGEVDEDIDWLKTYEDEAPVRPAPIAKGTAELRDLPYLQLAELASRPVPPRQWALAGFMPMYKTTMLTGKGGVGKSLLAQVLCTCTALGLPFMGMAVREMPALYMTWEDDHDELWRRQAAICAALGVPLDAGGDWLNLVSMADQAETVLFQIGDGGRGAPTKRGEQVMDEIDTLGGLFVFDNATQIYSGDHDSLSEVGALAHWLNRLAIPTAHSINKGPRAGLLLHHPNKAGAEWLGSVSYENQFRSRLYMDRPDTPDMDMRRLSNPKANYSATGGEVLFRWHEGSFVRDQDLPDDTATALAATAQASYDNGIFLACLRLRNAHERPVSENKASRTYAPREFAGMPESKGIGIHRLEAAMDRLYRINELERGFVCRKDRKDRDGLRECADLRADPALSRGADL